MKTVKSDGSAVRRGDHWYGAYGIAIYDGKAVVEWENGFLGRVSDKHRNNEAELQGALKTLEYIKENFSDERIELLVDNFNVYETLKYQLNLHSIAKEINIRRVDRKDLQFADMLCDWIWHDPPQEENELSLSNFQETHSKRADYCYQFEPQAV